MAFLPFLKLLYDIGQLYIYMSKGCLYTVVLAGLIRSFNISEKIFFKSHLFLRFFSVLYTSECLKKGILYIHNVSYSCPKWFFNPIGVSDKYMGSKMMIIQIVSSQIHFWQPKCKLKNVESHFWWEFLWALDKVRYEKCVFFKVS